MMAKNRFIVRNYSRIRGSRYAALDTARARIAIIAAVFAFAYVLVFARAFDLSVIQRPAAGVGEDGGAVAAAAPASAALFRADILDRNGVMLATTLETASLYADPALILDPAQAAKDLAALFPDLVYGDLLQKLQKKSRFVWLRRGLTPQEQYAVLALGHPGLDFRGERRRVYPQGPLAAHMVGYTDIDGRGLAGIERSFDRLLGAGGAPLQLSLDIRLQHVLRRELAGAIGNFSALGGAGAIMDIASGEILAAVSLPDFDPHHPGDADGRQKFNNLTLGVFELGSTFKIFTTAALLESGQVGMDYMFDASAPLKRGRFSISDYHPENRAMTVPEVFMHSSNIGTALMAEMLGPERLRAFFADLGLLAPLGLEIEEIGTPLVPSKWGPTETITASYGHGIAVSPLQMTAAAASIVNGGIRVTPTLIAAANKAKNPEKNTELRIVSPQTAHRMRQLLRLAVTDGTGKSAEVAGYNVGGKTGTAEKMKSGGRGYDGKKRIASFVGFFPMEAPRYAVLVMIDEPKGTKESFGYATAGWVAAPAVARVVAGMSSILGLPPAPATPDRDIAAPIRKYFGQHDRGGIHASQ